MGGPSPHTSVHGSRHCLGILDTLFGTNVPQKLLFEVNPTDPATRYRVAALFATVGLPPDIQASRVDLLLYFAHQWLSTERREI